MRGHSLFRAIYLSIAVAVAGCGGGGGSTTTTVPVDTTKNPLVSINWPARSRPFQAPASALSVKMTLKGVGPNNTDVTVFAQRSQDTEYTQDYALPIVPTGAHPLVVRFYADPDGVTESANVTLTVRVDSEGVLRREDGRELGDVTTQTRIAKLVVDAGQNVPIQNDQNLSAHGESATGSVIAVTPGSIFWTLVDTPAPDRMTLNKGGVARGARIGWADVKASIDGVVSAPTLVKVGWQLSTIVQERNDVLAATDAPGDGIWAVGTDGALYLLSKSGLVRGTALTSVGSASAIARSVDNKYVYIPTIEGCKRWNTSTQTLDKTFLIDNGLTKNPQAVAVDPTTPTRTAIAFTVKDESANVVALFEDGTRKFSALSLPKDEFVKGITFDTSGRRLLVYTDKPRILKLDVDVQGLTLNGEVASPGIRSASPYLQVVGSKLYTHNLDVYDVTTLAAGTSLEKLGDGYGLLAQKGITPRLYSAQLESSFRANGIVVYQDSGSGLSILSGLDLPTDRLVTDLISVDENGLGYVYMSSAATLVRVNVSAQNALVRP